MVQTDPSQQQLPRPQTQAVVTPSAAKSQHGLATASKTGSKQQHNRSSHKATATKEEKKSNQGDSKGQQFKSGMRQVDLQAKFASLLRQSKDKERDSKTALGSTGKKQSAKQDNQAAAQARSQLFGEASQKLQKD